MKKIKYLSSVKDVSMTDEWFTIANPNHFWIKRRFDVFKKIIREKFKNKMKVAEIGCGNGLVLNQCEKEFGVYVDGYELNDEYLKKSITNNHNLFCYDVHQKNQELKDKYDLIILFDIIEHIDNDSNFLDSVLFHLQKGGYLAINVPAHQKYFSRYDEMIGHKRRYSLTDLRLLAKNNSCELEDITYWGFSLLPLLIIRKYYLKIKKYKTKETIQHGFNPKNKYINKLLGLICKLEYTPQRINGTSILALFKKGN